MKYSLLIIEDEPLEQRALSNYIAQHFPQIHTIWTAKNSRTALEIAYREKPDIYLVDINIPGKSGLVMIEELVKNQVEGKFIITTAYDTFDYAKKAVSLGCDEFLLKPIQDLELTKALQKCFAEIEEQRSLTEMRQCLDNARQYNEMTIFDALCQGQDISDLLISVYGWPRGKELCAVLLCVHLASDLSNNQEKEKIYRYVCRLLSDVFRTVSVVGQQEIFFLAQPKRERDIFLSSLCLWMACNAVLQCYGGFLSVSETYQSYRQLSSAFSRIKAMKKLELSENQPYFDLSRLPGTPVQVIPHRTLIRGRIVQRLRENGYSRVTSMLDRLLLQYGLAPTLHVFLEALMNYGYAADQLLERISVWDDSVFSALLEQIKTTSVEAENAATSDAIDTALRIMRDRCGEPLMQAQIAEEVGLTPAYFSRLFKKKTGENFVNVLTNLRMEKARELLFDETLSITEIAFLCGYANKKYFKQTFREKYNQSVEEYRKEIKS